jgi:hypothetical protein
MSARMNAATSYTEATEDMVILLVQGFKVPCRRVQISQPRPGAEFNAGVAPERRTSERHCQVTCVSADETV